MSIYRDSKRIVGTNTERIGADAISGGWKQVARTTLSSAGDTVSVTSIPDKRFYMILSRALPSGNITQDFRYNNDSSGTNGVNGNYSRRKSTDGGTEGTDINQNKHEVSGGASYPIFSVGYCANKSDQEKLIMTHSFNTQNSAGNANPSTIQQRIQNVGKWANTSDAINRIDMINSDSGSYDTDSEVVVLGWDPDDTHTDNFWEQLASVELSSAGTEISSGAFTSKKYLWVQVYCLGDGSSDPNGRLQVGSGSFDAGNNYVERQATNHNSDGTNGSQDHIPVFSGGRFGNFTNRFIINESGQEKLFDITGISSTTEAVTSTPNRRMVAGKWSNVSGQIDRIKVYRTANSNYQAGSFIKVWGAN